MPLMRSSTACFAPSPTASIAITEPTPMTMPSSVSAVRNRFARSARAAAFAASTSRAAAMAALRVALRSRGARAPARAGPGSLTMRPSRDLDHAVRLRGDLARVRDEDDGVALGARARCSSAITSAPLLLSSAPVGSSARMIWPPFMSARAIDTRCCWPPESWLGPVLEALAEAERGEQRLGARAPLGGRHAGVDRRHLDVLARRSRWRSGCSSGTRSRRPRAAAARARRARSRRRPRP